MAVPTYDKFIEPVLRYLARHPEGATTREVCESVAESLKLTEADRAELLPSGAQAVYRNRVGWAHDRLKRAKYSSSPRRGFWKLTPEGLAFAKQHPEPLSARQIEKLALVNRGVRLRPKTEDAAEPPGGGENQTALEATVSPDDRLGQALDELRQAVVEELLEVIKQVSPTYFETIVLDLLHAMGYGTSRSDLQRVGGSGDGGIDGIISLDRLGLEKVYIQAKRWQNSVGRPEVQAFYGALAGQRANKGVFITTSTFTTQAVEFARSVERVVLVDGDRLAMLMIEYGVGVTHRIVKIPKLDSDYFEE